MMPPLNLNAKVVVPCASLIFACGFCDMEFVYVERNAAGYEKGWHASCGERGRKGKGTYVWHSRNLHPLYDTEFIQVPP